MPINSRKQTWSQENRDQDKQCRLTSYIFACDQMVRVTKDKVSPNVVTGPIEWLTRGSFVSVEQHRLTSLSFSKERFLIIRNFHVDDKDSLLVLYFWDWYGWHNRADDTEVSKVRNLHANAEWAETSRTLFLRNLNLVLSLRPRAPSVLSLNRAKLRDLAMILRTL